MILYVGVALALALGALVQMVAGFGSALLARAIFGYVHGLSMISVVAS